MKEVAQREASLFVTRNYRSPDDSDNRGGMGVVDLGGKLARTCDKLDVVDKGES